MSAFARWLRSHRLARIATIVLTFLLPLTNVVSAAVVVMSARAAGWRSAAIDVVAALLILGGLVVLTSGEGAAPSPGPAALGAGALWGGGLLGGALLGRFRSVDLALQALVVAALAGVVLASLAIPDSRAHWQPVLQALIEAAGLPRVDGLPPNWLSTVAALMHGVIGASLLFTLILALMLGLWLDRDGDAGDWRRKFLEFRLGRVLSLAAAAAVLLLAAGSVSLGGGLLLVLGTGFAAQGLAIVHWTADERGWPRVWPLVLYVPLMLGAPPAGLVLLGLALAGLVDNGFPLRRRRANVV
ncbi:MAG: hypothetical protein JNK40_07005 [Chromatiales bacterium]|nr:hypothetical protein [Chromatiales bacterium]